MIKTKLKGGPHYVGSCPSCGVSWDGGDIPEKSRRHYSPPYKWSRLIGIEIPGGYDGISYWQCPECKTTWDALTKEQTVLPEEIVR